MTRNVLDDHGRLRLEEELAANPNGISIGVGQHAMRVSGLSMKALADLLEPYLSVLPEGAALIEVQPPGRGPLLLYYERHGREVNIGTRPDFIDLGWQAICDALDEQAEMEERERLA